MKKLLVSLSTVLCFSAMANVHLEHNCILKTTIFDSDHCDQGGCYPRTASYYQLFQTGEQEIICSQVRSKSLKSIYPKLVACGCKNITEVTDDETSASQGGRIRHPHEDTRW